MKVLKDVYVLGSCGLILDKNFKVIDHPKNFKYYRDIYKGRTRTGDHAGEWQNEMSKAISDAKIKIKSGCKTVEEPSCYMMDVHSIYPYGHLYDSIQRLKEYTDNDVISCQWITSRTDTGHTRHLIRDHFKVFDYPDKRVYIKRDDVMFFRCVYMSEHSARPSQFDPIIAKWIRDKYFKHYSEQFNSTLNDITGRYDRIVLYLDRPPGHVRRGVINRNEIIDYLREKDAVVLNGSEGLVNHMAYFHKPDIVIGPHGSLFRNSLFTKDGHDPLYYEFCPDNRIDTSIKSASMDCGVKKYTQELVKSDSKFNIKIPLSYVKSVINK